MVRTQTDRQNPFTARIRPRLKSSATFRRFRRWLELLLARKYGSPTLPRCGVVSRLFGKQETAFRRTKNCAHASSPLNTSIHASGWPQPSWLLNPSKRSAATFKKLTVIQKVWYYGTRNGWRINIVTQIDLPATVNRKKFLDAWRPHPFLFWKHLSASWHFQWAWNDASSTFSTPRAGSVLFEQYCTFQRGHLHVCCVFVTRSLHYQPL